VNFIQFDGQVAHIPDSTSARKVEAVKSPEDAVFSQAVMLARNVSPSSNEAIDFNILPSLPLSLFPHADDIYITYTRTHLLQGEASAHHALDLSDKPAHISKIFQEGLPVRSFLAAATTYFGRQTQQVDIMQKGLQRYGRALSDLNKALADEDMSRSLEVLDSVITMAFYEVSLPLCQVDACECNCVEAHQYSFSSRTTAVAGSGIL
jgi:hypothetical protein